MRTSWSVAATALFLILATGVSLRLSRREPAGREAAPAEGIAGSARVARVARVIDGDTLQLAGGELVRLWGVDAPEKGEPLHEEASRAARDLLSGRRARVETAGGGGRDGYGRTLALVRVEGVRVEGVPIGETLEEVLVNEELVERGLARIYLKADGEPPPGVVRRLVAAQNRAISSRLGIWKSPRALAEPVEALVETRFRFHRAGCSALRRSDGDRSGGGRSDGGQAGRRRTTREAALRSGKSPCRSCNPRRRGGRRRGPACFRRGGAPGWMRRECAPLARPGRDGGWRAGGPGR